MKLNRVAIAPVAPIPDLASLSLIILLSLSLGIHSASAQFDPLDPLPVQVSLMEPMENIPENIGTWVFYVSLDRPRIRSATMVSIELQPGTATPVEDYIDPQPMVFFGPGQMLAPVPVHIIDNDRVDGDRTFSVILTDASPGAIIVDPMQIVTIIDDDEDAGEATCRFEGNREYEDGTYDFAGKATVDDNTNELRLIGERNDRLTVDLSDLAIGDQTGEFTTQADGGRYRVEMHIEINADPAGVAEYARMTGREKMQSGTGLPERLAQRRLKGELVAHWAGGGGSGANRIVAQFDAGNGPYHCEGGLDAQQDALDAIRKMMRDS